MALQQVAISKVTRRWQTVIPTGIRRELKINAGDSLAWINDGQAIRVIVVPADPVAALMGSGKGEGLYRKLLIERAEERRRDR